MNFYEMTQLMENISYTALVLTPESRSQLLRQLGATPDGWEVIAHHMTINMGPADRGPAVEMVGQTHELTAVALGQDERVMAVQVQSDVPSDNSTKHITIAVNRAAGGKPFHSNQLGEWSPISPISLKGVIEEVPR